MDTVAIQRVIQELLTEQSVTDASGTRRDIFPVALTPRKAAALREWVLRERAARTIEVGLAYAFSTLHICEALLANDGQLPRHVAIDPNQVGGYDSAGLRVLHRAGIADLVEFYNEDSQLVLPRFVAEERRFDMGFVDG